MTDLAHDEDGSQIAQVIAANDAHMRQVRWYDILQNAPWDTWSEQAQLAFFYDIPTMPLRDIARFVN